MVKLFETMRRHVEGRTSRRLASKVLYTLVLSSLLHLTVTAQTSRAVVTSQFVLLTNPYLKFVPLGVKLAGVDLFTCARLCLLRNNSCFTFFFNELSNTCSLGAWPTSSPVAISHVNTYRSTQPCNTAANFTLQQSGDVRVCVRMSPDTLNYTDAREVCKESMNKAYLLSAALSGNLYTVKNLDKLSILKTVCARVKSWIWVGLNDMETEDVFKWEDDGSVATIPWRRTIFYPGEPNNADLNEDCVFYSTPDYLLYDNGCYFKRLYICEMPIPSF